MTLSTTTSRISYTGDGATTAFAFPYKFTANADLVVTLVDTSAVAHTQVYGTNYTMTGAGLDAGGTVTFTAAPPVGYSVIIYRDPQKTQANSYSNNDPFPATTTEGALDKLTMIAQRLAEQASRSVHLSDVDSASDMTLPFAAARANAVFRFDADGLPRMAPPTEESAAAAQGSADAAASALAQTLALRNSVSVFTFASIALLKAAAAPAVSPTTAIVQGYYAANDGGGGEFYWSSTSSATDDSATIIQPSAGGTGRWIRIV